MSKIVTKQNMNNNQNNNNMENLSNQEIKVLMNSERMSLTMAPGGENNRGMEIIGRMPIKGEGFTAKDIEGLGPYFEAKTQLAMNKYGDRPVAVLDLNALSLNDRIDHLSDENQARVLILRDYISNWHGGHGSDIEIYKEIAPIRWDAEYLDPNKYRTEIVDGKEVKVRGKRMNKLARTNLCFVADREQKPAVFEGKGTIYDLKKLKFLNAAVERLRDDIAKGLIAIGSKTKVVINVVEGNRYYDLKKTGIGFHGDTERVVVICLSIGGWNYPMRWQWFKDGMPVGKQIDIHLNSGDVYIMSEKSVGADWKKSSLYTLRHAAGADKYRSLSKWDKRRSAYEARLKRKAEIKAERAAEKLARQQLRKKQKAEAKSLKKAAPKKIKAKKIVDPREIYTKALQNHEWVNNKNGFYKWLAIESEHECSPNHAEIKELYAIWTGKAENWAQKMTDDRNIIRWNEYNAAYGMLCIYGKYF
tara:strand:- start:2295 stop:3716 length:1422 start_codon:yes stop_codon:yes gene_type:complete